MKSSLRLVYRAGVTTELLPSEARRYGRHLLMKEIGVNGQIRLKHGRVLIIGAGGLGTPASIYLAAAGVGTITIVDDDIVEESNLHRQVLYTGEDTGQPKASVLAKRLQNQNPLIQVEPVLARLTDQNAANLVNDHDVVIDATDNFATRYLLNDACFFAGKPLVYGAIFRFEGQVAVFNLERSPCYRCLFPNGNKSSSIPNCAEAGVLGVLPGIIGSLQAAETLKILLGLGDILAGAVLTADVASMRFQRMRLNKQPNCALCGEQPTIKTLSSEQAPVDACATAKISAADLAAILSLSSWQDRYHLVDVRSLGEWETGYIQGAEHLPIEALQSSYLSKPTSKTIVLYCQTGVRSARAAHILRSLGHQRVFELHGGMISWPQP